MKKSTLGQLAILGITSGLLSVAEGGSGLYADTGAFDAAHTIAKPKCNGLLGCGGLTAMGCGSHGCNNLTAMKDEEKKSDAPSEEEQYNEDVESEENELDENAKKKASSTNTRTQNR